MIAQRSEHLSDSANRTQLTRAQVAATQVDEADALLDGMADATLDSSWPAAGEQYAPYLQTAVGGTLLAPLTARLAITIAVTGILFSAYIYLLCIAVVGPETASEWSGVATPSSMSRSSALARNCTEALT